MIVFAGIGFRDAADLASVLEALDRAGGAGLRQLALPDAKAGHPVVTALTDRGFSLTLIGADDLAQTQTLTQSAASRAAHGTGSVAEACALCAAGPGARLLGPRSTSGDRRATAALAQGHPQEHSQEYPKTGEAS